MLRNRCRRRIGIVEAVSNVRTCSRVYMVRNRAIKDGYSLDSEAFVNNVRSRQCYGIDRCDQEDRADRDDL